jgi:predicted metal-dependent phosphoesterase TrpH
MTLPRRSRSAELDPAPDWKRCDLHLHTSFSGWRSLRALEAQDCYVSPRDAFDMARARGMDFVCFSDHDTIDGALDFLARHPEEEARVIVAEEVETRFPGSREWVHVNVFDVDESLHADLVRLRGDCFELVAELNRRGTFFALNHPFQSFRSIRAARCLLPELFPRFPAIEVVNGTSPRTHRPLLQALLSSPGLDRAVWVGGSDAHTLRRIAGAYTAAPGSNKRDFLDNVREGVSAIGGEESGMAALIGDVYTIVGTYYAQRHRSVLPPSIRGARSLALALALLPASLVGLPALLTLLHALRQEWIAGGFVGDPAPRAFDLAPVDAEGGR